MDCPYSTLYLRIPGVAGQIGCHLWWLRVHRQRNQMRRQLLQLPLLSKFNKCNFHAVMQTVPEKSEGNIGDVHKLDHV